MEGLMMLLLLQAAGFADFAEILAFGDKRTRLETTFKGRGGNFTNADMFASQFHFPCQMSAGIRICLDSPLRFLPSLLFSEFGRFRGINQVYPELLVPRTEHHLSSFKCGFLNIFSRQNVLRSLSRLLFLLRWNKNGAKRCLKNHIPFDF